MDSAMETCVVFVEILWIVKSNNLNCHPENKAFELECENVKSHFEFLILFLCRRSIEYVHAAIVMWVHWGLIMMFSIRIFSCRTAIKISQYQLIQLVSIIHSTPTHPHVNCQWGNSIIQSGYQLGRML